MKSKDLLSVLDSSVRSALLSGLSRLRNDSVKFIQIGGNDGLMADPLFPYHSTLPWSGAIVEPIPYYFQKLSELNNSNQNLRLYNYAISDSAGTLDLWQLNPEKEDKYPPNFRGLASGSRQHLINHGVSENDTQSLSVESITPARLLELEGSPRRIDLLCIDVEGHELPIITNFPFERVHAELVFFEAWHMNRQQRDALAEWCASIGMRLFFTWEDGWMVKGNDELRASFLEAMQELSALLQSQLEQETIKANAYAQNS
jgi:FkbM family methyltransferase